MSQARENDERDLLAILIENKAISQAQASLVKTDQDSTGMSVAEVLIARGWVSEETLKILAPWLDSSSSVSDTRSPDSEDGTETYEANLKKYRKLMAEILGESSE